MVDVNVQWTGDMQFVGESLDTGHSLVMDTNQEHGGRNSGFRPMHLLLLGLGGCSGMDVVSILKKMRQRVTGLTISVRGEQVVDDPHIYKDISVEYIVRGEGVSEAAVEKAVRLSEEKYCSVIATLRPLSKMVVSWKIEENS